MNPLDDFLSSLTPEQRLRLKYDWPSHARKNQLPPELVEWLIWIIQAGRGFGKTRAGNEQVRAWAAAEIPITAIIAPTSGDLHKVILDGPAGLFAISPPDFQPVVNRSTMTALWPNGAKTLLFSAEEPERLRGPQFHKLYCDELAAWRYPETFDNAMLGLRLGEKPQCVITTTPKPSSFYRKVLAMPGVVVTRGSTLDNRAHLSRLFIATIVARNIGTRRGRQELQGELIENVEGALWSSKQIDALRVSTYPDLEQVAVAVDPAVSNNADSDETGITVCGRSHDSHFYLLDDASGRYDPDGWARRAVALYRQRRADFIVAEVNQGGALVEATLRAVDPNVSYKGVHASRGKITRAQPIASLTEQGRIHHVGNFPELEEQLCNYDGSGESPDRLDAFVHAMTFLSEGEGVFGFLSWAKDLFPSAFVSSEPVPSLNLTGVVDPQQVLATAKAREREERREQELVATAQQQARPSALSQPCPACPKCGSACTDRVDVQLFFCKMCSFHYGTVRTTYRNDRSDVLSGEVPGAWGGGTFRSKGRFR